MAPEVNDTNFRAYRFTRDTVVDYKCGNPVINCIFKKFDKDLNEKFDDNEWAEYQKYIENMENRQKRLAEYKANPKVVSHYNKKIDKIIKQQEKLYSKFQKIDQNNYFNQLLEFEKQHPEVYREGYTDPKDCPKNAMKYDISSFQMGIYDEDKKCFTGKTYEKGYIAGLETLTEAERKEYLSLLDKASKDAKKSITLNDEVQKLNQEIEKFEAMLEMVNNGIVTKVGSKEYENQIYEKYQEIRASSNPFFEQLQEMENLYNTLANKPNRTQEENLQLEQYKIQLQQLKLASESWSIKDYGAEIYTENTSKINGLSQRVAISQNNNGQIAGINTAEFLYSDENINASGSLTIEELYKKEAGLQESCNLSLQSSYSRDNFSTTSSMNLSNRENNTNLSEEVSLRYNNAEIKVSETFSSTTMEIPDENGELNKTKNSSNETSLGFSYSTGNFSNSAAVNFAEEGRSYNLSTNGNFNINANKNLNISLSPSFSSNYNDKNKSTTISPSLIANIGYSNNDFKTNLMIMDNFSNTVINGAKPQQNNMFTASSSTSYKGCEFEIKVNDMDNTSSHSTTYGIKTGYNSKNAGKFALEYAHQNMKLKMQPGETNQTDMVTFTYTAPLQIIDNWFKHKKSP